MTSVTSTSAMISAVAVAALFVALASATLRVAAFSLSPLSSTTTTTINARHHRGSMALIIPISPSPGTATQALTMKLSIVPSFLEGIFCDETNQSHGLADDEVSSSTASSSITRSLEAKRYCAHRQHDTSTIRKVNYSEKSSLPAAVAIVTAVASTMECYGSVAIAADIDDLLSDSTSSLSPPGVLMSSELSSTTTSDVIESMPPSAISGKALSAPNEVANGGSVTVADVFANRDGPEFFDELPSSEASTTAANANEGAAQNYIRDDDGSVVSLSEVIAPIASDEQTLADTLSIENKDKNDVGDSNSIAILSKTSGYNKIAATLPNPSLSLLVVPASIMTVLVLLTSASTDKEDTARSDGDADIASLSRTDTVTHKKIGDQRRQKEWNFNAPVPYGLQEGTPKWSSLTPPPPKKKSITPPLTSSTPPLSPTSVPEQWKNSINRESKIVGATSLGASANVSQTMIQPQKGSISRGDLSGLSVEQQPKEQFVSTFATTKSNTSPSVPKRFSKSAYKESSINKVEQQPLANESLPVAYVASGGVNVERAGALSSELGSIGMAIVQKNDFDDKPTTEKGTSAIASTPQIMDTFVGQANVGSAMKGASPTPVELSSIPKTASSPSSSNNGSATKFPKSYAKSSFKKSSLNREIEPSIQRNMPAPAMPYVAKSSSENLDRVESVMGNAIRIGGGMLKGKENSSSNGSKSFSKSSFKTNKKGAVLSPNIPGGGYLNDLSGVSSSISSTAGVSALRTTKDTNVSNNTYSYSGTSGEGILKSASDGSLKGNNSVYPAPISGSSLLSFREQGAGDIGQSVSRNYDRANRETEFLSDLVQAEVPSNLGIERPQASTVGEPTPDKLTSAISQVPPQSTITAVRIGSATRFQFPRDIGDNSSRANTNLQEWSPMLSSKGVKDKLLVNDGADNIIGFQPPRSVTILDPRTGKQRTISVSSPNAMFESKEDT